MSFGASALTTQQIATLKTACTADTTCNALAVAADDFGLADWFNAPSTFIVWRTSVGAEEIMQSDSFDWTRVDNLSNGKARIWDQMFRFGAINPSKANVRAGIDAVWVGTAADLAVRATVTWCASALPPGPSSSWHLAPAPLVRLDSSPSRAC